ncbi:hypothetical protein [Sphingomonas sp. GB1N7]|uniref:hypothetical protein n=1 Tax=Parasphingomonas caseinilytica TaxID=3096158 RepID=UPI002FCB005F
MAEQKRDVTLGPIGGRLQQHPVEALLACQIFLRRRWPVVRQLRLIADQPNAAEELALSQACSNWAPPCPAPTIRESKRVTAFDLASGLTIPAAPSLSEITKFTL